MQKKLWGVKIIILNQILTKIRNIEWKNYCAPQNFNCKNPARTKIANKFKSNLIKQIIGTVTNALEKINQVTELFSSVSAQILQNLLSYGDNFTRSELSWN